MDAAPPTPAPLGVEAPPARRNHSCWNGVQPLRGWAAAAHVFFYLSMCVSVGVTPFIAWHYAVTPSDNLAAELAWLIAGCFCLWSFPPIAYEVARQFDNWRYPTIQRHVIVVLLMVPVYAVDAWLSLRFLSASVYIDFVREVYEAFVILSFYRMLCAFLKTQGDPIEMTVEQMLANVPRMQHILGMQYFLPKWTLGVPFKRYVDVCVLCYVIIEPICAAVAIITEPLGYYSGFVLSIGNYSGFTTKSYPYILVITNLTQIIALYGLVLFYDHLHHELAPLSPLWKFIVVKGVVFFSFWQSVIISALQAYGYITTNTRFLASYSADNVALGLQDFLICLEMLVAAFGHYYAFRDIGIEGSPLELAMLTPGAHILARHAELAIELAAKGAEPVPSGCCGGAAAAVHAAPAGEARPAEGQPVVQKAWASPRPASSEVSLAADSKRVPPNFFF